jgi:hypothetical protein
VKFTWHYSLLEVNSAERINLPCTDAARKEKQIDVAFG